MIVQDGACLRQIVDELLAVFGHLLGTYTLPDGATTPAHWTVRPDQVRPERVCTGIEMTLQDSPEREVMGGGGCAIPTMKTWTLTFTQFNTASDLREVRLLAYRRWPRAQQRHQPQTGEMFERLTIELPDPCLTTPL